MVDQKQKRWIEKNPQWHRTYKRLKHQNDRDEKRKTEILENLIEIREETDNISARVNFMINRLKRSVNLKNYKVIQEKERKITENKKNNEESKEDQRKNNIRTRDRNIIELREKGETLQEIGERWNLSRERVRQILEKNNFRKY
jgi:DNA-directed RNA polymerase sigma subunit (sigma70/sigma32)